MHRVAITLDTNKCENIKADGATLANVGSNKQISYTILLGKGLDTKITADVTDFEMDAISINGVKLDLKFDIDDKELMDKVQQIMDASKKNSGASSLQNGTEEFYDKTGTLTFGEPDVIAIYSADEKLISEKDLYAYTAAGEKKSEHPLGKAVVSCFNKTYKEQIPVAYDFQMIPGRGISAVINSKRLLAGNINLLKENNIAENTIIVEKANEYVEKGSTIKYVAMDTKAVGFIALADTLRPESAKTIKKLYGISVEPVLLTGDNENAAKTIAHKIGIATVRNNCLPEDKLKAIEEFQNNDEPVCMIGDGINDAPALKKANVGITMGGIGSEIAVDALVHNAGSVMVIINSALLLKWKMD